MAIAAAFLALAAPAVACAEPVPQALSLRPIEKPASRSSECSHYLPGHPLADGVRGITDLRIHIAANGNVSNARVTRSSGDWAFDAAAVACADNFFFQPAIRDGRPVDVDWVGRIDWHLSSAILSIALADESRRQCARYPDLSRRLNETGTVNMLFDVTASGEVQNLRVAPSSGSERLDNATLACVAQYRYFPATRDGQPIAIGWRAAQTFVMH